MDESSKISHSTNPSNGDPSKARLAAVEVFAKAGIEKAALNKEFGDGFDQWDDGYRSAMREILNLLKEGGEDENKG